MKTYKIHLIRHGLTRANLDGIYCGSTDIPLCDEGRSDLAVLCAEADFPYVEAVYTSPLSRAVESARILFPDTDIVPVEDLREASFGPFENRAFSELKKDPDFQKWVTPGTEFIPDGIENPSDFVIRCQNAMIGIINEMIAEGIHSAAVVTHASVIGNILAAMAFPQAPPYDWQCDAGYGFTVCVDPSIYLRQPVVEVIDTVPRRCDENENNAQDDPYFN